MQTIIHKIRLKPGCTAHAFERWVREVDYEAAAHMPSVLAFAVHRCAEPEAVGADYFEIITVSDAAAFDADMKTRLFASLAGAFDEMAAVVDEIAGPMLGQGYSDRSQAQRRHDDVAAHTGEV